MQSENIEHQKSVRAALRSFAKLPSKQAALSFLAALGYSSSKTVKLDGSVSEFLAQIDSAGKLMDVVVLKDWVTDTKVTLFRSNTSTSLEKSISERDSRSIL